ncbi:hypothetical protein GZ77_21650 [Endozoicomonas montiporae]|uniref:Uncharacterized protein n=2 Tax=Endozoicomonas montiporae TaxID=1027273 RepID=A0A081N3K2_9GAMM|nr:hypothetical protein GZ77_21650 [Endozoicomonas montiporae]
MLAAGLPMPPVPRELSDQLLCPKDTEYFTTRSNTPNPWNLIWFIEEIEQKTPEHYLIFGVDGHGVESAAAHYYLVEQDIAVFHQSNLPTPSRPRLEADLTDQYELMATMAVAASDAKEKGKLPEGSRIILVRPVNMPSSWGIQPAPGQPVKWQKTSDALLDVSDWLQASLT